MDKQNGVYIYNVVLFIIRNFAIGNNISGTGGHYPKWNKSGTKNTNTAGSHEYVKSQIVKVIGTENSMAVTTDWEKGGMRRFLSKGTNFTYARWIISGDLMWSNVTIVNIILYTCNSLRQ